MDRLLLIVEQHRRDERLAIHLLLLVDQAVEAAYRVALQARHGAASVQDEYQFRKIVSLLFHCFSPFCIAPGASLSVYAFMIQAGQNKKVASEATFL